MVNANLIVTYDPTHAVSAEKEVSAILQDVKEKPKFLKSAVEGTFLLRVKDPKNAVSTAKQKCKKNPSLFQHTHKWTPVEKWCSSALATLAKNVAMYDKKIRENEKWKMELNKRLYKGSETELIMKLTEKIQKKNVDLEKPEKIIRVEIIKNKAGLALLTPDEQLNTHDYRK